MLKKIFAWSLAFVFAASLFAVPSSAGEAMSVKEILNKIQANQGKIKDMYAETITTIVSDLSGLKGGKVGPQKMVQKGKMWTKGKEKSRIEMLFPMKQITINNGDKMAVINSETGQKIVQDMKKLREKQGLPQSKSMDLEEAMKYFNLSVNRQSSLFGEGDYIIVGIPKEENKFLSKMEFYVDPSRWIPVKIRMYGPQGKLMSESEIEYKEISGVWIPVKNVSSITSPAGKMKAEMEFSNIKVNQGIKDSEFSVE